MKPISLAAAVLLSGLSQAGVPPPQFQFTAGSATYEIHANGTSSIEVRDHARTLHTPDYPFATVKTTSGTTPSSTITQHGAMLTVAFGATGIEADFVVSSRADYFVVRVDAVRGGPVDQLCFAQVRPTGLATAGALLGVRWSDDFAVSVMGLQEELESRLGADQGVAACATRSIAPLVGQRAAVLAVGTSRFLDLIAQVEQDNGLPSPKLAGQWAKRSEEARNSYLFVDLDEANVDQVIEYAKLGHFRYILIYSTTWSSSLGSYPINVKHFPGGEAGLTRVIEKCHRAGIKVGMHMLTSMIDKNDPLAHAVPLAGLLHDAEATLETAVDDTATAFLPTPAVPSAGSRSIEMHDVDLQIEDEVVRCGRTSDAGLDGCRRGLNGTTPAAHPAGARVQRLVVRLGTYLADLRGPLKDVITARISGLVNAAGFDMIYFDGADVNFAQGPEPYWLSAHPYSIWKSIHRDVLVQGSALSQWSWHFFTRGVCDDFASIGTMAFLDLNKIAVYRELYRRNFMPAELGWVNLAQRTLSHPATQPDELEYLGVKMLALNVPAGIESTLADLKGNGRTDEILRRFAQYEDLRLAGHLPDTARQALGKGEWQMSSNDGPTTIAPVDRIVVSSAVPGEVTIDNRFKQQPFRFRAQVEPVPGAPGDPANLRLLDHSLALTMPGPSSPMPGATIHRVDLTASRPAGSAAVPGTILAPARPRDLRHHMTLAVTIRVEGTRPSGPVPTINVQLQSGSNYRDHYLDLDFDGEKTILLREPEVERLLRELRPDSRNYSFKSALGDFRYDAVSSLNIRWMRTGGPAASHYTIVGIEAIADSDTALSNLEITIGSVRITVPSGLPAGSYMESSGSGVIRWFDDQGRTMGTMDLSSRLPQLTPGANVVALRAGGRGAVRLTVWTSGDPVTTAAPIGEGRATGQVDRCARMNGSSCSAGLSPPSPF